MRISLYNQYKKLSKWEQNVQRSYYLLRQRNKCCIAKCRRLIHDSVRVVMHHDHETGKLLGVAHYACNIAHGVFGDRDW
jgi:hypothetical protein